VGLALVALLAAACGGAKAEGDGTGIVRALGADGRSVTIEHGDVPGVMGAMTMEFPVEPPEQLAGVAVGDRVDFHLVSADGRITVTRLRESAR
jgi:Cu/Ag efflux protein CusF